MRAHVRVVARSRHLPIADVVDRGTVVFRAAEGTKLAAALLGRGVAFELDGHDAAAGEAWSVAIKGDATAIEQMHEYLDALDLPLFPWHAGAKHRFVRIEPVEITGRRFHVLGHDARATTNLRRYALRTSDPPPRTRSLARDALVTSATGAASASSDGTRRERHVCRR